MMNIKIICVGKLKEQFYAEAANEYIKRLSEYCKLEVLEIPEHRLPAGRVEYAIKDAGKKARNALISIALDRERAAIEAKIPAGATLVALCLEGREIDSNGLSEFLADCANRGASRLCFVIGGSFGLHDDIKSGAFLRLSMSK